MKQRMLYNAVLILAFAISQDVEFSVTFTHTQPHSDIPRDDKRLADSGIVQT